jgi:Fe-Mn family superoxide dismutase
MDGGAPLQLIDARPRHYYSRMPEMVAGARWRDPDEVADWLPTLKKDQPAVVFCAYGFHVGCNVTRALRDAGYDARYMTGGHSGWKAMGGKVTLRA